MSLLSILKKVGKDLGDVEKWVAEGIAVAAPIVAIVDPPLGPILTAVEKVLAALPQNSTVDAKTLQAVITSTATIQGATCATCQCCGCPAKSPQPVSQALAQPPQGQW